MEEILASIRRIIADDDQAEATGHAGVGPPMTRASVNSEELEFPDILALTESMSEQSSLADNTNKQLDVALNIQTKLVETMQLIVSLATLIEDYQKLVATEPPASGTYSATKIEELELAVEKTRQSEAAAKEANSIAQQRSLALETGIKAANSERDEWKNQYQQREDEVRALKVAKERWQRSSASLKARLDEIQKTNSLTERFGKLWNAILPSNLQISEFERGLRLEVFAEIWIQVENGKIDWTKHSLANVLHPDKHHSPIEKAIYQEICKSVPQIF
jgi:cell pole-organizing protein PopZ